MIFTSIDSRIFINSLCLLVAIFFVNEIYAAEGGPCKDYGECDKFKYSLILISILLALVLLFLGNLVVITPIILLLYLLFSLIYNFSS